MFEQAHRALARAVPAGLTRAELEAGVAALARLKSHVAERELTYLAAIDALDDGGVDAAGVARSKGKVSSKRAETAVATAEGLGKMPKTREKLARGEITEDHAAAAARAGERVLDHRAADDALSGPVSDAPADLFAKHAAEWADRHESRETAENRWKARRAARCLSLDTDRLGMITLFGRFDPEAGARLRALIDEETDRLWRLDGGRDGTPNDVRTPAQRRADALESLTTGGRPGDTATEETTEPSARTCRTSAGARPKHQGLVLIDADRLTGRDPTAQATIIGGGPLPGSVLHRLLCDAALAPLIVDRSGRPLWLGRKVRTATAHQWEALIGRDGGCIGCGVPPSHCEAHHLVPWTGGGTTDIDTMVLLCPRDHHLVHDHGYEVLERADGTWTLLPPNQRAP